MLPYELQWDPSNTYTLGPLKRVLIRGVSSFQGANNTYVYEVGTRSSVLIREMSSFQGCPLRGVPLYFWLLLLAKSRLSCLLVFHSVCLLRFQQSMRTL